MIKKQLNILPIIIIFFITISTAKATTLISADDGWHTFLFPGIYNPIAPGDYSWFSSFEFTLAKTALITVQDLGQSVDAFRVFDNGKFIFNADGGAGGGNGTVNDPDLGLITPGFSRGSALLAPGKHIITGTNIRYVSTDYGGSAALRVDTVNEPNSISLLIISLFLWVALSFRPTLPA